MKPTTVKASYKNNAFSAEIIPADIPEILRKMEGIYASDAKNHVIRVLTGFKGEYEDRRMAETLLWLACQGDGGEEAEAEALQGGATIEYLLTDADAVGFYYLARIVHESPPEAVQP
jgi:hypothetical protein